MRKTFKLFCAAALAALAVSSCYDDTFLRGEIDRLDGRVDSLASVLNKDVANLAALQSSVTTLETSLKQAIADGDAAVKKALEDALAAAETDLAAAIAKGDKAAADALAAEKTKIEAALKALETGLGSVTSDVEALEAALKTLEATVGTNYKDLLKKLDEVDGVVDGHIADMKTALEDLAAADEKFNKDLAAAIAKIVVSKVEEVNGKIVLTLADGTAVELSKPLSNVDNNGLVTIVEVEGVKYWSVVGAETHTGVPVGHPDYKIEFRINTETKELEYSVNKGEWISTGVAVMATDANVKLITGFEQTDDYVTIKIGDTEVVLPKYFADNSSLVAGRTDVFFTYGATKAIELDSEAVTECYVMSKPDGWKAVLKDGLITITAPSEDLLSIGAGETEGQVLVHATTNNGICKVVGINVTTGPAVRFEYVDGDIHVFNALYYTHLFMGMYEETEFYDLYFGMTTADVFMGYDSFDEYLQDNYENDIMSTFREYAMYCGNDETYYVAGEREEQNLTIPLSKILEYDEREMDEDETYIFWVLPTKQRETFFEYAQYAFENVYATMESSNPKFDDVDLSFNILGSDACYIGAVNKLDVPYYEEIGEEESFKLYLQNGPYGMGGPLMDFMYGTPDAMGELYDMSEFGSLNLSDVVLPFQGEKVVDAGSDYYVWVMPYVEGKDPMEYTVNDILVFSTSTGDMVYSATLQATVGNIDCDYFSVSVEFTPPADAKTYYKLYKTQTLENDYFDGESYITEYIVDELLAERYYTEESFTFEETYDITPSTDYTLVLYSTSNDGQYGDLQFVSCPTKSYEVLEDVVELKSFTLDESGNNYVATFTISDNRVTKIAGYNRTNDPDNFMQEYYLDQVKNSLLDGEPSDYAQYADVVNGEATLTFKKATMEDYFVYACVIEDEVVTALTDEAYLFNIEDALTSEE